ncbi:MAG: glycosyltransferase [Kiritimatiellaeota bacterium]|nr:glycosyltransferase [Kiritimatiellota bacterium]
MLTYPPSWSGLSAALAHDWLTGMRGGERVLEHLCRGLPRAPIHTLLHNPAAISAAINAHPVTTSWLQRVPGIHRRYRWFLPCYPQAIGRMAPPNAAVLISTSHCVAKGLRTRPGAKHLCYCFTPMRYAWTFHEEYFGRNPVKRMAVSPLLAALRDWDRRNSDRVDRFVTLSRHVQDRIRRFYGRAADVVHPPVDTDFFTPGPEESRGGYDLIVSALVPYKRVDLAVRAYCRLGWPLKIAGTGTDYEALRRLAGPRTEFLGWQSDEQLRDLYRGARLLLFPGEEDFGLVPLEAQACGRPVVAFARGGVLETVLAGETGVFFDEQTETALLAAVETAAAQRWSRAAIRRQAERFTPQQFVDGLARSLERCLAGAGR